MVIETNEVDKPCSVYYCHGLKSCQIQESSFSKEKDVSVDGALENLRISRQHVNARVDAPSFYHPYAKLLEHLIF